MLRTSVMGALVAGGLLLTACERQPAGGDQTTTAPTTQAGAIETAKEKAAEVAEAGREQVEGIIRMVRERYAQDVREQLAKHEAHIQEMQKKLAEAAEEARPALERRIADLKAQVDSARATLGRLSAASDDAWKELKKGLDGVLGELREALEGPSTTQPTSAPETESAPAADDTAPADGASPAEEAPPTEDAPPGR